MARLDRLAATRDFLFQARDAPLQLMGGERADVLTQDDVRQLLARLEIVEIHGFGPNDFKD